MSDAAEICRSPRTGMSARRAGCSRPIRRSAPRTELSPVLFEIYQPFASVSASGERLLGALAPPLLVARRAAVPGAARVVDGAAVAAGSSRSGAAALERDRSVQPGASQDRGGPSRRRRPRPCGRRLRTRATGVECRLQERPRGELRTARGDCAPATGGPRPANTAGGDSPSQPSSLPDSRRPSAIC
jgi:hypothetical protein